MGSSHPSSHFFFHKIGVYVIFFRARTERNILPEKKNRKKKDCLILTLNPSPLGIDRANDTRLVFFILIAAFDCRLETVLLEEPPCM